MKNSKQKKSKKDLGLSSNSVKSQAKIAKTTVKVLTKKSKKIKGKKSKNIAASDDKKDKNNKKLAKKSPAKQIKINLKKANNNNAKKESKLLKAQNNLSSKSSQGFKSKSAVKSKDKKTLKEKIQINGFDNAIDVKKSDNPTRQKFKKDNEKTPESHLKINENSKKLTLKLEESKKQKTSAKVSVGKEPKYDQESSKKSTHQNSKIQRTKNNKSLKNSSESISNSSFKIGDYVVYPSHGVGKIIGVEKIQISDSQFGCILVNFERERLNIKIPINGAEKFGLRHLVSKSVMDEVIMILRSGVKKLKGMWSRRAQEYETKINSGDIILLAEVLRDLTRDIEDSERSYSERIIYETAVYRLASEYAVIYNITFEEAKEKIINTAKDKISSDFKSSRDSDFDEFDLIEQNSSGRKKLHEDDDENEEEEEEEEEEDDDFNYSFKERSDEDSEDEEDNDEDDDGSGRKPKRRK